MSENIINENSPEKNLISKEETNAEEVVEKSIAENSVISEDSANDESFETVSVHSEEEPESRFQEYFNDKVEDSKPKMTDTLITFYDLRSIDEELTDIDEEKGDLPEKIESIKKKIVSTDLELNEKKNSLEKLEAEKSKLTEVSKSSEEKINKYDEQKYDVRSNKEYDEVVKTIESLFEEVKKNDIRIKEIDEVYNLLVTDIDSLSIKSKEYTDELAENQTLLDELDEQYKQDESGLREKRQTLISKLSEGNLNLYERINKSYKGEATAIVRKGNCSGCYNSIPPQTVIEIKSAEKIFMCQSCGRILISEEILASREN